MPTLVATLDPLLSLPVDSRKGTPGGRPHMLAPGPSLDPSKEVTVVTAPVPPSLVLACSEKWSFRFPIVGRGYSVHAATSHPMHPIGAPPREGSTVVHSSECAHRRAASEVVPPPCLLLRVASNLSLSALRHATGWSLVLFLVSVYSSVRS
jgi:hypothetical protein